MPLRSRALLAAGVIAVLASFALVRSKPLAPSGGALPETALASASPTPLLPAASASLVARLAGAPAESELTELLRAGRFDVLISRSSTIIDADTRRRWLDSCARLAPPRLVAEHASGLPAGAERERLLAAAVDRWSLDDPIACGEWAARHLSDTSELDLVLATLVERTDTLHRTTAAALAWANDLSDSALRLRALGRVVQEWAGQDRAAALRFAETTDTVDDAGRRELLGLLRPPVTET